MIVLLDYTWWLRVFEGKWNDSFEKDRESNGGSNVWCKTDGEKEDRGPNGDVGIEGNSGSDGKSEWSEMVRACVKEGWWACFEKRNWNLKWRERGSEDDRGRHGKCKWRRRTGMLVWGRRMHWIKQDGEWELERLLPEWGKFGHPHLQG